MLKFSIALRPDAPASNAYLAGNNEKVATSSLLIIYKNQI